MIGFKAVDYVGSGLTLTAFVAAAILYAYLARLRRELQRIRTVEPEQRIAAIERAAEYIGVEITNIPENQRAEIVVKQLNIKASRQRYFFILAVIFLFALVAIAATSIIKDVDRSPTKLGDETAIPGREISGPGGGIGDQIAPPPVDSDDDKLPGEISTVRPTAVEKWIYLGHYSGEWSLPRSLELNGRSPEDLKGKEIKLVMNVNIRSEPFKITKVGLDSCNFIETPIIGSFPSAERVVIEEIHRLQGCSNYIWARVRLVEP